ncbi:MAG TPA: S41 family peptidase [Blastocatellia bacterium]|nr:S41 family peptidase [Blastocatellia bacterium]
MNLLSSKNLFSRANIISKRGAHRLIIALAVLLFISPAMFAQGPGDGPDMTVDPQTRTQVIEGVLKQLNDFYVFPETAKKMEQAIRERMQKKEYDQITSARQLASILTDHLQQVSHDKHLRVGYSAEPIRRENEQQEPSPAEIEQFNTFMKRANYGFEKIERLPGNVGYLELRGFMDARLAGETAATAMSFLANADALIIDLRRNGGGDPAMVALISSYLFGAEPVHLNDLYWREGDTTHQWWTLPYVPGKRFGDKKPVYILTSRRTFSAAEEFTYNLKNLKRATIVGETTGGGAHPGGMRRVNEHFSVWVPSGRAINPISKTNWEGTGVKPDVEVPADQALKIAHVSVLKNLIETQTDERWKQELNRALDAAQRELDERKNSKPDAAAAKPQSPEAQIIDSAAIPNTPAGQRFAAWLKSINSGDVNTFRRFAAENAAKQVLERTSPDEIARMDQDFYNESGGLKLHSVLRSTDHEIEVLAQGKKNQDWVRIRIAVETAPPHGISELDLEPGSPPSKQ